MSLDGRPISKEELQNKIQESKEKGIKIVEVSEGEFKTLSKLNG